MADIVDAQTRSRMMSGIRGRNTRPELALRRALHHAGLRYRLHVRTLPGKPDLVFPRFKAVVFVHGCFWHQHAGCRYSTFPATRPDFWREKFRQNESRDQRVKEHLRNEGWRIGTVWECAIRRGNEQELAAEVESWLEKGGAFLESPERARIDQRS